MAISDQRSAISGISRLYDASNKVTAYEIPIYSKLGDESGSIIVNADKNNSVISSYGTTGASFSHELKNYSRELRSFLLKKGLQTVETRLYELDVAIYAIGLKLTGTSNSLKNTKTHQGSMIFIFSAHFLSSLILTPKNPIIKKFKLSF